MKGAFYMIRAHFSEVFENMNEKRFHFRIRKILFGFSIFIGIITLFLSHTQKAYAKDTIQIKREGFIYDEKGNKIGDAFLELQLFYKENGAIKSKIYETLSNDLGLYFFNIFIELDAEQIVAIRTFWKNYDTKFKDKYLKFTPGFNPYWEFTKDYIDNSYAVEKIPLTGIRDINLISMENPIPDAYARELALKFSPILVFDKDKKILPTNLEKYLYNHKVETYENKEKEKEGLPPYAGQILKFPDLKKFKSLKAKKDAHLYYHVRPLDTRYTGMQTGRMEDFRSDYYWYVYSQEKPSGYIISYWFWYDTTDGPSYLGNSHQGSLQGYAVSVAAAGTPNRLLTIGHNQVLVDTAWYNINSVNHHPILYVARGFLADGANVTVPNLPAKKRSFKERKSISVPLNKRFVDWFGFPRDSFPLLHYGKFKVIIPGQESWGTNKLGAGNLSQVLIGPGPKGDAKDANSFDFSKKIKNVWQKAIKWEEPGWINQAPFNDPDGHHNVDEESIFYMKFNGRLGGQPIQMMQIFPPHYFGQSPLNVPFINGRDNIFIYEAPRKERSFYFQEKEPYGVFWQGTVRTPQFVK
jgi:hypothetical protein